jgi:ADP-heptose:LPS heptosyltransferase
LGVTDDGFGLDFFYPPEKGLQQGDLPMSHSQGYVAIVIGASYATKKLPVDKLVMLCRDLEFPIVLVGGKEERAEADLVSSVDNIKVYNACGKFSLFESADIVRKANLVVSHDTGLQYIACAFNKKVIAIWGATSPKLDVEPYYGKSFLPGKEKTLSENILVPNLYCQPCSNFGTKVCPRKHFKCMKNMDMELIRNKIESSLK